MGCARYLGIFDLSKMYDFTLREYINLKKGAELAIVDAQERAIQAAWVSGIVSRQTKGRPKGPDKYFDAKKARKQILEGAKAEKPKVDFTNYDRMREDLKTFDWNANYVPKENNISH